MQWESGVEGGGLHETGLDPIPIMSPRQTPQGPQNYNNNSPSVRTRYFFGSTGHKLQVWHIAIDLSRRRRRADVLYITFIQLSVWRTGTGGGGGACLNLKYQFI